MMIGFRRYLTSRTRLSTAPAGTRSAWLARFGVRLAVAFLVVSALLPLAGLIAERGQRLAAARQARAEARHLAQVIAHDVSGDISGPRDPDAEQLRRRLAVLRRQVGGEVEIVDVGRGVIADTMPPGQAERVGTEFAGQIAATLRDGMPRTMSRLGDPRAVDFVTVPIRTSGDRIVGAVVLDYTELHHEVLSAGAEVRRLTIAAGFAGMAVALALAFVMSRGLVRDIRRLTQAAHQFAEGRYDVRVQVASRGELGQLAQAFNLMAERVAERKAVLIDLATTDTLTGLPNRRAFRTTLARDLAHAQRLGLPLSLLILDLDHFKAVNDTFGHLAGDAVLRRVGEVLQRESRSSDLAARLGGEEFGILLPGADLDDALVTAERLRVSIAGMRAVHQGRDISVTASVGAVSYPEHGATAETLAQAADEALYAAKHAGRNLVRTPPPG